VSGRFSLPSVYLCVSNSIKRQCSGTGMTS